MLMFSLCVWYLLFFTYPLQPRSPDKKQRTVHTLWPLSSASHSADVGAPQPLLNTAPALHTCLSQRLDVLFSVYPS